MHSSSSHNNAESFLRHQVEAGKSPSVQYAFFTTDQAVYDTLFGQANIEGGISADPNTSYHLFSITKTFTALAVLQLAEQGLIDIQKPIIQYLPDFTYDPTITIEQLLTHTAGLPNPIPLRWIHPVEDALSFDRDEFFMDIFKQHPKLSFAPGTKFKYSNLGYVWLGQLIEHVSNQSFEFYLEEHIFTPAGIVQGQLGFDIESARHATGYHPYWSASNVLLTFLFDKKKYMGRKTGAWQPFQPFYNNGIAYGGLIGTREGLIKYGQALLKKDSDLLGNSYKDLLFQAKSIDGQPTGMSMSWFTGTLNGHDYVAHAGGGGGYYVELRLYPSLGKGSVMMFNRSGMTDQRMLNKVDRYFLP